MMIINQRVAQIIVFIFQLKDGIQRSSSLVNAQTLSYSTDNQVADDHFKSKDFDTAT